MATEASAPDRLTGFRLSPQQRRLWLLQEGSRAFRAQIAVRIDGDLDAERLRRALNRVVARHASLRTWFRAIPGVKVPLQVVAEEAEVAWRGGDPLPAGGDREAWTEGLLAAELRSASGPAEPPLPAATLAAAGPGEHLLVLGLPALCADRASLANLVAELADAYDTAGQEGEATDYLQFSEWQHELLGENGDAEGRTYWRGQYFGATTAPPNGSAAGSEQRLPFQPELLAVELPAPLLTAAEALADRLELRLPDLLLGVWQALLWRLSERPTLVGHLVVDGRRYEELRSMLGLLAKAVPIRCDLDGSRLFATAARRVAGAAEKAREWQESYAWEAPSEPVTLFEAVLRPSPRAAGGAVFTVVADRCRYERFELALVVVQHEGGARLELWRDAAVYDAAAADRIAERLTTLLASACAAPEAPLSELALLGDAERRLLLVDFNRTDADFPGDCCLHELFAEQARRTPRAVAVSAGAEQITYAELDARANQLAHHLRDRGAVPEALVGLCLERSPEMVIGLIAVLKAGAAFVPLDPGYPREHLRLLLADAEPRLVLTRQALAETLAVGEDTAMVLVDAEHDAIAARSRRAPASAAEPEGLAYVLYTSGSAGRPKGVMVPHRSLVNYLAWCTRAYPVAEGSGAPVHSPIGFDLTLTSLLAPLLAGRTVTLLPEEQGVEALASALAERGGWSFVKLTPAHFELLQSQLADLSRRAAALIIGGEALLGDGLARWRTAAPETRLFNEYGPTETVVGCAVYEVPPGAPASGPVPIGQPIINTRIYLLDATLVPVPFGLSGELYVGGAGVARGYHRNAATTAERFVPDPYGPNPGARLYATGDLARRRADGTLEFLGRNDHQVKIRGFRVEPGEVEAALKRHPGVRESAVVAREDAPGDRRLVAYLVAAAGSSPNVDELRRFLGERLPEHMVPAAFVVLDALPLTANGKVDRAALPAPGPQRPQLEQVYVAPRTPLEVTLAAVWCEVLGLERIGVHDSFFALGGDSIRSVRAVALAREKGIESTVQELFKHQTVAELARELGAGVAHGEEERLRQLLEEVEALSAAEVEERLRDRLQPPSA
ncbi:MAG TPA: amino acid adenylation domain-containing protein [Thermoanaerobaculia bacterium]|nr:amino acid adenylation domain-containing protein [Thermoanaerobaculia bacterium]